MEIPVKTEVTTNREAPQRISAVAVLACAWPALLLATVCLLPFLNKPFLNDDPYFLTMSRQIVDHPMHPMDFDICWLMTLGNVCHKDYAVAHGNAVMGEVAQGYLLVPTVLGGAHEWMAHASELVLAWIAIVAMTSLILRLGWDRGHAIVGALLLVSIAPFLPFSSSVMPDILATALALVAMERLAAWKAEGKWGQGVAAAIALGLAGFARPHLSLLLPLAAFFLLDSTKPREIVTQIRRRIWLWAPVFAGLGLMLAIIAITREHDLTIHPPLWQGGRDILRNLLSYLLYLTFPLPLAACWLANRLKNRRLGIVFALCAVAVIPWLLHWNQPLLPILAVFGCGALAGVFFEALKRRDHIGLFLVLWILMPLPAVYYVQFPIKYLLPCLPAIILLCFRLMAAFPVRVARAAAIILILASTGYSILILRSDAEFAEFGRDSMYQLIQPHVAAGEKVWFDGQYCSYWYAPLAGATLTFPGGPQPRPGDLLIVDVLTGGDHSLAPFPHRTLIDETSHRYRFGRTMGAGIGLYSNMSGIWLWGVGDSGNDRFELWRID